MKYHDYYKTLGVERTASQEEIQKGFKKLARKYHPDINKEKGAEDKFKEINEAYEVLKDPEKRKRYDLLGSGYAEGQDFRPPPGFEGNSFNFVDAQGFGGGGGAAFSDFFSALFGGAGGFDFSQFETRQFRTGKKRPQQQQAAPSRVEAELKIPFIDAYEGGVRQLSLQYDGQPRTIQVKIPEGTKEGDVLRLAHSGDIPETLLRISVLPDPTYKVQQEDVIAPVLLTPWEAALGAKVEVKLPGGPVRLTVPENTQAGKRFRLKGRGLRKSNGERGDLFIEATIEVPPRASEAEKELWKKLSEVSSFNPRG